MAYEQTSVPVEKSQGEIRKLLTRYGAQRFTFSEGVNDLDGRQWLAVDFVHAAEFDRPHLVRIAVPLKEPDKAALKSRASRYNSRPLAALIEEALEQEKRRIWRVVFYSLKSRMESVAEKLETFEQAFLPHLVDPATGHTIWEMLKGPIEGGLLVIGGPGLPALPKRASG
jgi:hypothetical protein